jgi:hypothetical protein
MQKRFYLWLDRARTRAADQLYIMWCTIVKEGWGGTYAPVDCGEVKELCALVNYELLLCGRRREECAKKV